MDPIRRLFVPLALNDLDEAAIRYAAMVSRMVRPQRIYFAHVAERLDLPAELQAQFPKLSDTAEDVLEQQMKRAVEPYFNGGDQPELRYEVMEGAPLTAVLSALRRHEIDLAITGRKPEHEAAGSLSERIARKAPCSVLIVPRGAHASIETILVPVDFSDHSARAVDAAVALAAACGGAKVVVMHVYQVPIGYTRAGKTYEQFAEIMQHHAQEAYGRFMAERDLKGLDVQPLFVLDEKPAAAIKRTVDIEHADLLVLGSRGRTAPAAMLLGSVTERVLRMAHVPVLAVKQPGENMNFLEALLSV